MVSEQHATNEGCGNNFAYRRVAKAGRARHSFSTTYRLAFQGALHEFERCDRGPLVGLRFPARQRCRVPGRRPAASHHHAPHCVRCTSAGACSGQRPHVCRVQCRHSCSHQGSPGHVRGSRDRHQRDHADDAPAGIAARLLARDVPVDRSQRGVRDCPVPRDHRTWQLRRLLRIAGHERVQYGVRVANGRHDLRALVVVPWRGVAVQRLHLPRRPGPSGTWPDDACAGIDVGIVNGDIRVDGGHCCRVAGRSVCREVLCRKLRHLRRLPGRQPVEYRLGVAKGRPDGLCPPVVVRGWRVAGPTTTPTRRAPTARS